MADAADRARVDARRLRGRGQRPSPPRSPPTSAIDPRVTRYVDRADEFDDTRVVETRDDGRTLVVDRHASIANIS